MNNPTLFIGGKADGKRIFVPHESRFFYFPDTDFGTVKYNREILRCEDKDFHFFVVEGMSVSDAFGLLFGFYPLVK